MPMPIILAEVKAGQFSFLPISVTQCVSVQLTISFFTAVAPVYPKEAELEALTCRGLPQ